MLHFGWTATLVPGTQPLGLTSSGGGGPYQEGKWLEIAPRSGHTSPAGTTRPANPRGAPGSNHYGVRLHIR